MEEKKDFLMKKCLVTKKNRVDNAAYLYVYRKPPLLTRGFN